ncbi:MAG: DUF4178 domain-containing protein [Dehalococcoidia bacterium]|nr:DUF4178 domain-containing protein [Dehalococcoidia bacterium]
MRNTRRSKTIVCGTCGSQLDLTDPNLAILATLTPGANAPRTPIRPGMTGSFQNETWQVIGRIRYEEEGAIWDEFLMMSEVGEFLWLTEGEAGFTLYDPIVPKEPVDPTTVRDVLRIDGWIAPVRARGEGRVTFIEGEMTWRATVGDRVGYIDAQLGRVKYAIEWTPREIEYFRGEKITAADVRSAFGLPSVPRPAASTAGTPARSGGGVSVSTVIILIVVACIVFACIVGAFAEADDDSRPSGFGAGPVFVPFPTGGGGTGVSRGSTGGTRSSSSGSSRSGGSSGGGK